MAVVVEIRWGTCDLQLGEGGQELNIEGRLSQ